MKTPSLAVAAARVAVCARILLFGLLCSDAAGAAVGTTDAERVAQIMKAQFDRPGTPLSVDPVSVEGAFAVAGWSQGSDGGRALLQRVGNQWQIVLCAGDALLQPATLSGAGMTPVAAARLVANLRAAESRLPAARREQFRRFAGLVKVAHSDAVTVGELAISDAWGRATPPGVKAGGAFFTIVNRGEQSDTLVSLTSPAATMVELYRTTVENGIAGMRLAGPVVIAPGQTVKAEPGGLHVMLTGLKKPLVAGTRMPLVLTFRQAGPVTVQIDVQPVSSASHEQHASH